MDKGDKWPGPCTSEALVADLLAFDALPAETQMMATRAVVHRIVENRNLNEDAFDDGVAYGQAGSKEKNEQLQKRITVLEAELASTATRALAAESRALTAERQAATEKRRADEAERGCDRLRRNLEASNKSKSA